MVETIDKNEHGTSCVLIYGTEFISSKLYGLELHKLREFFAKGDDYLSREVFVVMMFKLLECKPEESPYILNGVRDLFEKIISRKNKIFPELVENIC